IAASTAALVRGAKAYCVASLTVPVPEESLLADLIPMGIEIAPLRERPQQIQRIVAELLEERKSSMTDLGGGETPEPADHSISGDVLSALMRYEWRGNVAQLKRVVYSAADSAKRYEIGLEDLPSSILAETSGRDLSKLERNERELLFSALTDNKWNREAAAKELGISRATIYRKIKQFRIRIPSSRN
ncbi:MAG: hypothetical protein JJE28_07280, partial [Actinomycetales bacterium]|nr:hypothetical protein [Actinomycetales bacterium]